MNLFHSQLNLLFLRLATEAILNQDPHIRSAILFGRGKFQNGVLIDPKSEFAFDASNVQQLVDFRNIIW
jgi:hypothetical protein